jgi:hypothetical protein
MAKRKKASKVQKRFRTAFFTAAGLGLAPATVRFVAFPFAAFVTLRSLPRLAELPLRIA